MPLRLCIVSVFFSVMLIPSCLFGQIGNNSPSQTKKNTNSYSESPINPQPTNPELTAFERLQDQTVYNKGFDKRRFFFGGDVGFQFGSLTAIELSPIIGYTIHRMFKVGVSFTFDYYGYTYYTSSGKFHEDYFLYGGSIFVRFFPIKYLFLHVEMQGLNQPSFNTNSLEKRRWMGYPIVGLGYNQPVSEKAALQLQVLWNFNSSEESIYMNPLISIGFNIGI